MIKRKETKFFKRGKGSTRKISTTQNQKPCLNFAVRTENWALPFRKPCPKTTFKMWQLDSFKHNHSGKRITKQKMAREILLVTCGASSVTCQISRHLFYTLYTKISYVHTLQFEFPHLTIPCHTKN